MEVAGQWRREWAGSAEYGKVTEGGVTRNVARAMEVLHASGPGARVRVMRAAYHSSAGPGAPASSYMMHSSRQVISSGYNFLEAPPISSKPLEISSTPFESSPENEIEKENYKVTEPDDYDISEPSKWRGASGKNSIRMPSEESSSADNASIIDLDSRTGSANTFKRTLQNKQCNDKNRSHIKNTRVSPLLDAPVALSTLKFTSILNGTDEWNNRRKSYSFEDTSPLNQNISPQNNSFTMDSSTDSGICKSSEIVNDPLSSPVNMKHFMNTDKIDQEESFKDWLSRNRLNSYRESSITPPRNYRTTETQQNESNITLQSSGKVSITLPFETQKQAQIEKSVLIDDSDRRTKRVEFCKTELHFAADTGTVNIIATDEKPPPSNDFRRRRSAFVPLNDKVDRSITLFGEKSEFSEVTTDQGVSNSEFAEFDENTAATKGILKNKIPKPKPYLLGENMVSGTSNDDTNSFHLNKSLTRTSAVTLINNQFQSDRRYSNETISSSLSDVDSNSASTNKYRTGNKGPEQRHSNHLSTSNNGSKEILDTKSLNKKMGILPVSSEASKTKIRELRGSDLAYFGIEKNENSKFIQTQDNLQEEIFHSVKLVQQVSNSVCNSEAESDDTPEYQNIPTKYNLIPNSNPRLKYDQEARKLSDHKVLKPISEQDTEQTVLSEFRNNSLKRHKDPLQPPHYITSDSRKTIKEKQLRQRDTSNSIRNDYISSGKPGNSLKRGKNNKENDSSNFTRGTSKDKKKSETPLYVNINVKGRKEREGPSGVISSQKAHYFQSSISKDLKTNKDEITKTKSNSSVKKEDNRGKLKENLRYENKDKKIDIRQESHQSSQKKLTPRRTEKLTTPENVQESIINQDVKKRSTNKTNYTHNIQRNDSLKTDQLQNSKKMSLKDEIVVNRKDKIQKEKGTVNTTKALNLQNYSTATPSENKLPLKIYRNATTSKNSSMIDSSKVEKTSDIKLDKSTKSKRSKYVINYDDKNGTVSSICKIKKGPGTYKRKMIPIENKTTEESNLKNKSLNKIALLQLHDRNWNAHNQRKWKSNTNVQRSCQLL